MAPGLLPPPHRPPVLCPWRADRYDLPAVIKHGWVFVISEECITTMGDTCYRETVNTNRWQFFQSWQMYSRRKRKSQRLGCLSRAEWCVGCVDGSSCYNASGVGLALCRRLHYNFHVYALCFVLLHKCTTSWKRRCLSQRHPPVWKFSPASLSLPTPLSTHQNDTTWQRTRHYWYIRPI